MTDFKDRTGFRVRRPQKTKTHKNVQEMQLKNNKTNAREMDAQNKSEHTSTNADACVRVYVCIGAS